MILVTDRLPLRCILIQNLFVCSVELTSVYNAQPSSGRNDVMAFVTGETADYKRSDAIAEMTIKWAQERREKLEVI